MWPLEDHQHLVPAELVDLLVRPAQMSDIG